MDIDPERGIVTLSTGQVLDPCLPGPELVLAAYGTALAPLDHGTRPYLFHDGDGGRLDGRPLRIGLDLYDRLLLALRARVDFYPADAARDWSSFSLAHEAEAKDFHDAALRRRLGEPGVELRPGSSIPPAHATLLRTHHHGPYPWGSVFSIHDERSGATEIRIDYLGRRELARRAFESGRRPLGGW